MRTFHKQDQYHASHGQSYLRQVFYNGNFKFYFEVTFKLFDSSTLSGSRRNPIDDAVSRKLIPLILLLSALKYI